MRGCRSLAGSWGDARTNFHHPVIARAVIKLTAAPARVRAYSLLYPDVVTALADADRLVDEKHFDGVMFLPRLANSDLGSYNVAQTFPWRASRFEVRARVRPRLIPGQIVIRT